MPQKHLAPDPTVVNALNAYPKAVLVEYLAMINGLGFLFAIQWGLLDKIAARKEAHFRQQLLVQYQRIYNRLSDAGWLKHEGTKIGLTDAAKSIQKARVEWIRLSRLDRPLRRKPRWAK